MKELINDFPYGALRKVSKFHLISRCGNVEETQSFQMELFYDGTIFDGTFCYDRSTMIVWRGPMYASIS